MHVAFYLHLCIAIQTLYMYVVFLCCVGVGTIDLVYNGEASGGEIYLGDDPVTSVLLGWLIEAFVWLLGQWLGV